MVRLELSYLNEIKRINEKADTIINTLADEIGLQRCKKPFSEIITESLFQTWTRDPFDRIITANALIGDDTLITFDKNILDNYKNSINI